MRKALGGGWRKPGPLAAAVLTALEDYPRRLKKDHEHAKRFAAGICRQYFQRQIINNNY
jgi:threonine aldolase